MVNLVKNAVKFVPSGFIRVGATRDGASVRLWVSDSGPGIPADKHEKLFQRFTQLGSRDQGTGIGLCVCQQIVQRMGGKIEIDSEYHSGSTEGPGSKFVVVARLAEVAAPSARKALAPSQSPLGLRGRRHVLFVDDDDLVRKTLRRTFEAVSDDWVLEETTDGESCLALAQKNQYDIITIDHHMHTVGSDKDDMNGTDLIKALRQLGSRAYVIGCSGNDLSAQHYAAGADAFWCKPFPTGQRLVNELINLPPPVHWRVLVVDDQTIVRRMLSRKLQRALPHVIMSEASTSALAAELIRSHVFDLMVLDQHIDDGGGGRAQLKGTDLARLARAH